MLSCKRKTVAKSGSVLAVVYFGVYYSHFFADWGEIRHRRSSRSTFEYLCVVKVSAVKFGTDLHVVPSSTSVSWRSKQ